MILTTDPRTGLSTSTSLTATTDEELNRLCAAALVAAPKLEQLGRLWRADFLDALADALEEDREILVAAAEAETGLTSVRLNGELTRSIFQFNIFAESVREGSYLEATIDHAATTRLGPAPDVRRLLIPIGPVAVFGSSNFPFAFSVPGGDSASALAAGNPIIVKAHSAHPLTCRASFDALTRGARAAGAPEGTIGIVYGQAAGAHLVAHPAVRAVGFTGSLSTGEILQKIISEREEPIPFYGELSSVNPLVISGGALDARSAEIAAGLAQSVIASAGQLCTKPGLAFVPAGAAGEAFAAEITRLFSEAAPTVLLNKRVLDSYSGVRDHLLCSTVVTVAAPASESGSGSADPATMSGDAGFFVSPTLLSVNVNDVTADLTEEAFGPLLVMVRYATADEVIGALSLVPKSLTATIHSQPDEVTFTRQILEYVVDRAGRIVFNGYPTGVRVSWAQHHGGPWPSTNTIHTSVGVSAARRFLRPLAWQDAPEEFLPLELHEDYTTVPRRIDGTLVLAS
jgi:NADP-dependent aldehyde dehydrogenase